MPNLMFFLPLWPAMSMRCMSTFRAKGLKSKEALPCVLFHRRPKKLAKAVTAKGGRTDGGNLPTSNGIPATMTVRHGTANIASPTWELPHPPLRRSGHLGLRRSVFWSGVSYLGCCPRCRQHFDEWSLSYPSPNASIKRWPCRQYEVFGR